MIIYSKDGKRPAQAAVDAFLKLKETHSVFISDGKIYSKKGIKKEYVDALVEKQVPFCLCSYVVKNDKKIPGCWNPTIICCDNDQNYNVAFDHGKTTPFGLALTEEDGVQYSNTKWKPQPKLALTYGGNSAVKNVYNMYKKDTLLLLTWSYMGTAGYTWDKTSNMWINNYSKTAEKPYGYLDKVFVDRIGAWVIDESALDVDISSLAPGTTSGKQLKRIKKHIVNEIKTIKKAAFKQDNFDFYDKDFFVAEMRGAWLVYDACKILASHQKKICRGNLTKVLDEIVYKWASGTYKISRPEDFYEQYITEIEML